MSYKSDIAAMRDSFDTHWAGMHKGYDRGSKGEKERESRRCELVIMLCGVVLGLEIPCAIFVYIWWMGAISGYSKILSEYFFPELKKEEWVDWSKFPDEEEEEEEEE